jgi:hypothetical protein
VHVPRRLGHRHRSRKFISTAAHEDLLAVDRWLERRRLTGDGELVQVTLYIELAYRSRADSLLPLTETAARSLRSRSRSRVCVHPNYEHAKHLCAWNALGLMRELSDRKITGTKDSAFRVVTGLLYEAVSGRPDADLKRACDSVLQDVNLP